MKGLTITRKLLSSEENKVDELLPTALLILVAVICLPLILAGWGYMLFYNYLTAKKAGKYDPEAWYTINKSTSFIIKRKAVSAASISDAAASWFDTELLMLYRTEPESNFFTGYFTNFSVNRIDGIFVQKVFFNDELEVDSMPLYFFCYETEEAEEIMDLKEYVITDTKGGANDFILSAGGEDDELELRFTKSPD
jgi:hypothetical protein